MQQDLDDVVQVDPNTERSFIILEVSCVWNEDEAYFQPTWTFLNAARVPLVGQSARRANLERFWQYLPTFYLGALRDVDDEFSSRSQFWGRLLRAMEIPADLGSEVEGELDSINRKLLKADPRLAQIAETLMGTTRVAARGQDGAVDLRLVPLKSWDLLSKAEIILRNEPNQPFLPLQRHGQGAQSLSVIFLFKAFVKHLLAEFYVADSAPILALEEPETHLHPQATRTLWMHVNDLPGQKIITTHSPYFVQHVPFRDLRLVRLTDNGTEVRWLPPSFSARIPHVPELNQIVDRNGALLKYEQAIERLTVHGKLGKKCYRSLLACYGEHPEKDDIHGALRDLRDRALLFVDDKDLGALETFARRIRGEIFFARRWLIVEGQAEYLIVYALARELGYDLDEHGISLIDAVNNGNPAIFAVLARALDIPWLAVFDGDGAGERYIQSIIKRGFDSAFVNQRCRKHTAGNLEEQLLADGWSPNCKWY